MTAIWLTIAAGVIGSVGGTDQPNAHAAEPLRVLPLGSSTTAGSTPGGYRLDLYQMLVADGRSIDFVGSRTDAGPAQLPDRDHEGHGGYTIDQLDAIVADRMQRFRPDIVLMHAGANDVLQNLDMPNAPARLARLIDHIVDASPGVIVYVSTVGPLSDPAADARARSYNTGIGWIVQVKANEGKRVRFVDMRTTLTAADVAGDQIHLTHGGNSKMAYRWYGALVSSPVNRYEAEDGLLNNARRLTTVVASNNGKAGYIDFPDSYLQLTIDAPYGGPYRMFIRGSNGTSQPCTHTMTVNGTGARTITYAPYGWENWTMTGLDVTLRAGRNTVRLAKATCYAEIDAVDLAIPAPVWPPA